ncbi:IQ-DOMAIN 14-like protein [Tanacetum coccineum]
MGKVTRWFRGVLGMKKDKVNIDNSNAKTKKRWSFGKCMKDLSQRVTGKTIDSTRMRSCISALEKEQNKHAIAVGATTAAVAGAQAAVAVARLTSEGRDTLFSVREKWAATKIQSVYKGHLAQLAIRSKRAELAVQPKIRYEKSIERFDNDTRREIHNKPLSTSYDSTTNLYDESPKIVGMEPYRPHGRSRRNHYPKSGFIGKDYKCSKNTQSTLCFSIQQSADLGGLGGDVAAARKEQQGGDVASLVAKERNRGACKLLGWLLGMDSSESLLDATELGSNARSGNEEGELAEDQADVPKEQEKKLIVIKLIIER